MNDQFRVADKAAAASRKRSRRRALPVTVTPVNPRVMNATRKLAGGDARRLRVLGPDEVLVENQPRGGE